MSETATATESKIEMTVTGGETSKRKITLPDNMVMAALITFAFSAICYEAFMPERFVKIYRLALLSICALTWVFLSFRNGMKKKWQFELFAALFWMIPQLIIYLQSYGPRFMRFSLVMYALSELSSIILSKPAQTVGGLFGAGTVIGAVLIVAVCFICFAAGLLFEKYCPKIKR